MILRDADDSEPPFASVTTGGGHAAGRCRTCASKPTPSVGQTHAASGACHHRADPNLTPAAGSLRYRPAVRRSTAPASGRMTLQRRQHRDSAYAKRAPSRSRERSDWQLDASSMKRRQFESITALGIGLRLRENRVQTPDRRRGQFIAPRDDGHIDAGRRLAIKAGDLAVNRGFISLAHAVGYFQSNLAATEAISPKSIVSVRNWNSLVAPTREITT